MASPGTNKKKPNQQNIANGSETRPEKPRYKSHPHHTNDNHKTFVLPQSSKSSSHNIPCSQTLWTLRTSYNPNRLATRAVSCATRSSIKADVFSLIFSCNRSEVSWSMDPNCSAARRDSWKALVSLRLKFSACKAASNTFSLSQERFNSWFMTPPAGISVPVILNWLCLCC